MVLFVYKFQYNLSRMGCAQSVKAAMPNEVPDKTPILNNKKSSNYSYLELEQTQTGRYVISPRTKMKLQVSRNQDFLTHHFLNQLCLSPYATTDKIRARQIIQHCMFNDLLHKKISGEHSTSKLTEFALKAWFQRTFLDCLQKAEDLYFNQNVSYQNVRERIAEEYTFQIFKMGEFINSGLGKFGDGKSKVKVPLSIILLNSDSALYPLLTRLQEKYPLVQQSQDIAFPQVQPMSQNINLLKLINSQSYTDPNNLNIQTTYDDLKFLINQANNQSNDFRSDMISLLGPQTLTDCKVKRRKDGDKAVYNAAAVRRVFIKWSQTLIERIPDIFVLDQFLDFVKSKKKMADTFIFKSIISETTHEKVIKCLSEILQAIKYQIGTTEPRQQFGLFLYDLLRCKTTRKTGEEIVALLETLKNTKLTVSGKRFEVVRIKNRFKNATRDILVNFRYGEHLVGQAQLCIDSPHDSPEIAKKIKFRHYLYQLQRGLFGPTFELIMQYQDFARKDIQVTLQAEGMLKQRKLKKEENIIKKAGRKCPQKHQMIAIKGNIFSQNKFSEFMEETQGSFNCDFCSEKASFNKQYHYCYYCTVFYCLKCLNVYKNTIFSKIELSCDQNNLLTHITSLEQIANHCRSSKAITIILYRQGRPACRMFLDQVIYLLSTYNSVGKQMPTIYALNIGYQNSFQSLLKKYQITRLPTTLLLNASQQPQLTLIGSTFHDIEGFIEVQKRIKSNLPKGIKTKCKICDELMSSEGEYEANKDQKCQTCMDANKIQDFGDLIKAFKYSHKDFVCKNGHVKCGYCSYLSSNKPSFFRDHTGRSYLSNKILFLTPLCQKKHMMDMVTQPPLFTCSKCQKNIENITDEEAAHCSKCQQYLCVQCLQFQTTNFREQQLKESMKSIQIVSHFVEDQAEEAWPCGCGNLFLKVYQSKKRDKYGQHNILKNLLMRHQQKSWTCYVCKQQTQKLKLHLACFYCQYANKSNNQISHIEICMNCSMKSGLINQRLATKSLKQETNLKCIKEHDIIKKNIRQTKNTFFECVKCKKNFYSSTQRFECETCNYKCCKTCSIDVLVDPNPPTAKKTCKKNHQLGLKRQKPGLQFCNQCHKYLQGKHFICNSECRYYLCIQCAQK